MFYKKIKTNWGNVFVVFDETKIKYLFLPGFPKIRLNLQKFKITKKKFQWLSIIEDKIKKYFSGKKVNFNCLSRIDLSGYTEFERKVLKTLRQVKYGELISYKELAEKSGKPKGYRSVGNIMAKNKTPLLIPCHRVIKSNGEIGNFGYGSDYKKKLLKLEKSI